MQLFDVSAVALQLSSAAMLFDQSGYRRYTREECALLEEGARRLAADLFADQGWMTGIAEFDRMSMDEKLVALHAMCVNAASDEEPGSREMWQDATLMAVLENLTVHVEIASDLVNEGGEFGRKEIAELAGLLLSSRLSYDCDIEAIRAVPFEERSGLDEALLQTHSNPGVAPTVAPEFLLEIIEGYKESLFPEWDFLNSEATLDLTPPEFEQLTNQMGTDPGYHINTAPSCSPQALREARTFLFGEQSRETET